MTKLYFSDSFSKLANFKAIKDNFIQKQRFRKSFKIFDTMELLRYMTLTLKFEMHTIKVSYFKLNNPV